MPIRPELRKFYGRAWRQYRLVLLEIAGHRCANCGAARAYLNCAHIHHDPRDGQLVAVWCPSCHSRKDAGQRWAVTRRTRAKKSGQLWLTPELEYAPFAAWMVPRRVIDAAQLRLFE